MSDSPDDLPADSPLSGDEALQRRQMQRMRTLSALADGIARSMGDLLHSARVQLQMTHEDIPEDHVAQNYLNHTLENLGEIETLVEHLLILSKKDIGGGKEEVDMVAVVEEVLSLAESAFPSGFTFRTRYDEDCTVVGAPAQLQQLVANLVTNAGMRMQGREDEQPTVLDTSVRKVVADPDLAGEYLDVDPGTYVHIAVSNTGEGSAPNDREAPGTSVLVDEDDLYLSVALGIVNAHGGEMTVRDEPDEGITYNVYLPSDSGEDAAPDSESPVSARADAEQRILVVDDDKTVRTLEEIRLSRLGHDVVTTSNSQEALAVVRETPEEFDVILVDYHMPDMNGPELVHALREEGSEASVVLMTGLSAQISESKARVMGIDHILRKPVESHELRDLLAKLES